MSRIFFEMGIWQVYCAALALGLAMGMVMQVLVLGVAACDTQGHRGKLPNPSGICHVDIIVPEEAAQQ